MSKGSVKSQEVWMFIIKFNYHKLNFSDHSCSGATEALSFLILSLRGKIKNNSKSLITLCIKIMLTLATSHEALRVFIEVLQELVQIYMESPCFGGKSIDKSEKEHKVCEIVLPFLKLKLSFSFG